MTTTAVRKPHKRPGGKHGKGMLRILALLLLSVMLLSQIPVEAFASEDDGKGDTSLSWKALGGSETKVGKGVTGKNYYILEASTGTIRDGGAADNVVYFNLHYTLSDGTKHNTVLMPKIDAMANGYEIASAAGSREARRKTVEDTFLVNNGVLSAKQTLRSVSTDQFLFEAPGAISSIDKLQIFGAHTTSETTWSCQGLRIYRVDTLYGLDMYGWYSDSAYIDFDGEVICDMDMGTSGGNFKWRTAGGSFNIVKYGDQGGLADCKLINASQKSSYKGNTKVGTKYTSQVSNKVVFGMDIADQGGAGLETLALKYANGSNPALKSLSLPEAAALTVRYIDIWGEVREVTLPFAVNALGSLLDLYSDVHIAGYAQQGDTVAVPLMLPAYQQIVNVSIVIGNAEAESKAGLHRVDAAGSNQVYTERVNGSESDDLRYLNFRVYEDATKVSAAMDGATVRYRFDGNPISAAVSTSVEGLRIAAKAETYFYLQKYTESTVLRPTDRMERYLITLYTDNVENAGTVDDLLIHFDYVDLSGSVKSSQDFNIRDYISQFYGEWPGNTENFAYNYSLSQAGKAKFMIPLPNVKNFVSVSYKLNGNDEWQVKGCQVQYVDSYSTREGRFEEVVSKDMDPDAPTNARFISHVRYTREVQARDICFTAGQITGDMGTNPDYDIEKDPEANPNSDTWVPGDLVQDDGEWKGSTGEGKDVVTKDDVDWASLINGMTYDDTLRDLGFTKQRRLYTVHVKVGSDKVNTINDDCGSANLFYFQLIFENGSSGVVLANQQIDGDAFRTGADVYFDIPTVVDYGELSSIQIIPDDQDSNSNIYDKLKISYIEVMQQTDAALVPTWRFESESEDGLGWVGIDYRDTAEQGTKRGAEGHSAAEIATSYDVTSATYSAKLQINIQTGAYQRNVGLDAEGNPKYEECRQLIGGLSLDYHYENAKGNVDQVMGLDAIYLMDQYAGRRSSYNRTYDTGLTSTEVSYAVSNPLYHFRAGRTDSFFVTVSDITKIVDMTLYVRSDISTNWTINNVSVHLVNGTGRRYLNASGEYAYSYPSGQKLSFVTQWTADTIETYCPVYGGTSTDGSTGDYNNVQAINISFQDAPIKTDKQTNTWTPVINREPKSKNDTLNLFIYPATKEGAADPSSYYLSAGVIYKDAMTLENTQAGAGTLDFGYDSNGQPVFSKIGISAANLDDILGVTVQTKSSGTLSAPISYGILQRIRSGVLIDTYYLSGVNNADRKSTMSVSSNARPEGGVQRILMQVQANNPTQNLIALERDVALAIYFRPAGAESQELRSKYIYLTDAGINSIRPGQIVELDFDVGEVAEIVGFNVVKTGTLDIGFENVMMVTQATDGTILDKHSVEDGFVPTTTPSRINVRGSVELLTLDIKTGGATASSSGGTNDPVRMTVGYYDVYDSEQTLVVNDIRPYIQSVKPLQAGATDTLKILIPNFEELRYVQLEPYNADSGSIASWTLESLGAAVGLDGGIVSRTVSKNIVEGTPETIFLGEMVMVGTNRVTRAGGGPTEKEPELMIKTEGSDTAKKAEGTSIKNGEIGTLTVESGANIFTDIRISGSSKAFTYRFVEVDAASGLESSPDFSEGTYSYTEEELTETYNFAVQSAAPEVTNEEEVKAAKAVIDLINTMRAAKGRFTEKISGSTNELTGFEFATPRNYSKEKLHYRLEVTAIENTEISFTLDILVGTEEDQLEKAIADWEKVRSVGDISIMNVDGSVEESRSLLKSDTSGILLESGESLQLTPRVSASDGFTATLSSYDPATQAKGKASTEAQHSYSEDTLVSYESKANTMLNSDNSLDEERSAAQNVLNIIAAMRSGSGSFTSGTSDAILNAPRNYTGSNISYLITVESAGEEMFSLVVTVKSENDTLKSAYDEMIAAEEAGNQARDEASKAATEPASESESSSESTSESSTESSTESESSTDSSENTAAP